jgi:hypothetical protein
VQTTNTPQLPRNFAENSSPTIIFLSAWQISRPPGAGVFLKRTVRASTRMQMGFRISNTCAFWSTDVLIWRHTCSIRKHVSAVLEQPCPRSRCVDLNLSPPKNAKTSTMIIRSQFDRNRVSKRYPISPQSEPANDTPVPARVPGFSTEKYPALRHRGETSSLSTAHAEDASPPRSSRRVHHTRAIVSRARIHSADRRDSPPARSGRLAFSGLKTILFRPGACTGT